MKPTELSYGFQQANCAIPQIQTGSQIRAPVETVEQRAKRRQDFVYPLWARAQPPITSHEDWARRASKGWLKEMDRSTPWDWVQGKTKKLRPRNRLALAKPLGIASSELPE
jgi:hypothetical protein